MPVMHDAAHLDMQTKVVIEQCWFASLSGHFCKSLIQSIKHLSCITHLTCNRQQTVHLEEDTLEQTVLIMAETTAQWPA